MTNTFPDNFGFYAILTNPKRGYEYCTHILVEEEIPFVQLRMKDARPYNILQVAEKLRQITEGTSTRLIINDHPQVAIDCEADGVHIGQDDQPFDEVKLQVGASMIVGLSTHNPKQTEQGCEKNPHYIGIGPVYATPTKKIADPVIGIDGMQEMLEKATVPAVCLGGISFEQLPDVLQGGAKNFSMVRPLCEADDPRSIVKKITLIYKKYKTED